MNKQVYGTKYPTSSLRHLFVSAAVILLFIALFTGAGSAVSDNSDVLPSDSAINSAQDIVSLAVSGLPEQLSGSFDSLSTVQVLSSPAANIAVQKISWSPDDESFMTGVSYTVSIRLSAIDALFSSSLDCTVNGSPAIPVFFEDGSVLVEYTYPADAVVLAESSVQADIGEIAVPSLEKITVTAPEGLAFGESGILTAVYSDASGGVDVSAVLLFEVADESVVRLQMIDAHTAKIISMAPGLTTITVSLDGDSSVSETVEIFVTEPVLYNDVPTMMSLDTSETSSTVSSGIRIYDQDNNDVTGTYVTTTDMIKFVPGENLIFINPLGEETSTFTGADDSDGDGYYTLTNVALGKWGVYVEGNIQGSLVHFTIAPEIQIVGTLQMTSRMDVGQLSVYYTDSEKNAIDEAWRWDIEDDSVLRIDEFYSGGYQVSIHPEKVGVTKVTATSVLDPSVSVSATVTVEETIISSLDAVSKGQVAMETTGSAYASAYDQYGHHIDSEKIQWSILEGSAVTLSSPDLNTNHILISPSYTGTSTILAEAESNPMVNQTIEITVVESMKELGLGYGGGLWDGDTLYLSTRGQGSASAWLYDSTTGYDFDSSRITWSVDDTSVISLTEHTDINNPNKHVTLKPLKVGTATVTATADGLTKSFTVVVEETVVTSVDVRPEDGNDVSLDAGSFDIAVRVLDQFGGEVHGDTVTLSVDNSDILTLSKQSIWMNDGSTYVSVSPKTLGTATISATVSGNAAILETCSITVHETEISSFIFRGNTVNSISLSSTPGLSVIIYDQFGEEVRYGTGKLQWSSSNPDVLEVRSNYGSQSVSLIPKSVGQATITAAIQGKPNAAISHTMKVEPTIISLIQIRGTSEISLEATGSVHARVFDQFGDQIEHETVLWSVDDPSILSLSQTATLADYGVGLKPLKAGTTTIHATVQSDSSITWSQKITVEETEYLLGADYVPEEMSVVDTEYAYARVVDQFGNIIPNEGVEWTIVSGHDVVDIEVSSLLYAEIQILPKSAGTAVLQVSSVSYPSLTHEFTVHVLEFIPTDFRLDTFDTISLSAGGDIRAVVYDQRGYGFSLTNEEITWTITSGNEVIDIEETDSSYVMIHPKMLGTATVKAVLDNYPGFSDEVTFTVVETIPEIDISVGAGILSGGTTGSIYAYIYDQFGYRIQNGENIVWSVVSGSDVLTLGEQYDSNFVIVHPQKPGTAVVRAALASDTTVYDEAPFTVVEPELSLQLQGKDKISTESSGYVYADLIDQFNHYIDTSDAKVRWEVTSGSDVITLRIDSLNNRADILPQKPGTATIQATLISDPTLSQIFTVTVEETQYTSLVISGNERIPLQLSSSASAGVLDQFSAYIGDSSIVWEVTSGSDVLEIETSKTQPNYITITPKKLGTATIKATSVAHGLTAEKEISVVDAEITLNIHQCPTDMAPNAEGYAYASIQAILPPTPTPVPTQVPTEQPIQQNSVPLDWTVVSGEAVIELEDNGYNSVTIHSLAPGTAVLRASALDGTLTAEQTVTVVSETERHISAPEKITLSRDAVDTPSVVILDQFGNRLREDVTISVADTSIMQYTEVAVTESMTGLILKPQAAGSTTLTVASAIAPNVKLDIPVTIDDETIVSGLIPSGSGSLGTQVGETTSVSAYAYDQYYAILPNEELELKYDTAKLSIVKGTEYGVLPILSITPRAEGETPVTVTVQNHPEFTATFTVVASGFNPVIPTPTTPPSLTVPSPTISPDGKTFSDTCEVTIDAVIGDIFYTVDGTTPTTDSLAYNAENKILLTETTTVKAIAVDSASGDASSVVEAHFIKFNPDKVYTITVVQPENGGTITVEKTEAKADELVTVTLTANNGWQKAGWVISGETTGISEKSADVSKFAMPSENVIIYAKFVEDKQPVASTIKFAREPGSLYTFEDEKDKGTLTAVVYDQFGKIFADSVTWSSDNTDVIEINAESGAYIAKAVGMATITATSVSDNTVKAAITLVVYTPPKPSIIGAINGGNIPSVVYGKMSESIVVYSEYTSYLYWDWGDGAVVKGLVSWPYPRHTTSTDSMAHTFVKYGDVTVTVTPSNNYRDGDAREFIVTVTHPTPSNLVITAGPKAVTAGDTATYTAFATNAKSYVWYLNGAEISGQTGATAQITFPNDAPKNSVVSVKAYNGIDKYSDLVTKDVSVAQKGGVLGEFGTTLTTNPTKPVVGELTTFNIPTVENAVKYHWKFANGKEYTTTAAGISHTITGISENTVTVTAYNSIGETAEKMYTIADIGEKPTIVLSQKSVTVSYSDPTTLSVTGTSGTYTWYLDGTKVSGETGSTYTKTWTRDDIGAHTISVTVDTTYGTATDSCTIKVETKEGAEPIIDKIIGKDIVGQGNHEKYHVVVHCKDDYTIDWYLNGAKIDNGNKDSKFFEYTFKEANSYELTAIVTTEYDMTATETIVIEVIDGQSFNSNKAKEADKKSGQKNSVKPKLTEGSSNKNSLEAVSGLSFDQNDLNEDGDPVSVSITTLDHGDLNEFTYDMGQKGDMLLGLDIKPTGLKNEKDLASYALLTIKLPVSEVGDDPSVIAFFRFDTGSDINGWEVLTLAENPKKDETGYFWIYTIQTGGMSQFVATFSGSPISVIPGDTPDNSDPTTPVVPGDAGSSGNSFWLTETPTPSVTPTDSAPTDTVPTDIPTTSAPTQTPESPGFSILAVLAGLGAVAVLRRR